MPVDRRALRRLLAVVLAIPVFAAVYFGAAVGRVWAFFRPAVAVTLGAGVIGTVYAEEALKLAPARVTPLRAAGVLALAVVLVGASGTPAPTVAAQPAEAVIAAAHSYVGTRYQLGAEGPNRFDCSGLMYRIFADAGELPRIGGKRLRAVGYLRWFSSRGLASRERGRRGDMVIYGGGRHIGIYLGDGRVLSALTSGVAVHPLHGINYRFTTFLRVQWGKGDGTGGGGDDDNGGGNDGAAGGGNGGGDDDNDNGRRKRPGRNPGGTAGGAGAGDQVAGGRLPTGFATGTLNLRKAADPDARIIGWVTRGSHFKVLGTGHSPSGALWLNVKMANGKTGWIWAHWTRVDNR